MVNEIHTDFKMEWGILLGDLLQMRCNLLIVPTQSSDGVSGNGGPRR